MTGVVHVVGAGLSGLSAAVRLVEAGRTVMVHEAAGHAGGRCRSYHDPQLGMTIDNGNHLVLSGNGATFAFLDRIGGREAVSVHARAEFPFIDLAAGERWTLRLNKGRVPWWILDPSRRIPGTQATDYAAILRLLSARPGAKVSDVLLCEGPLYERLWRPVLLAALNIDPWDADATLAAQILRETFGEGGHACRPVIVQGGLSNAFVEPALRFLEERGAVVRHNDRLHRLEYEGGRVAGLVLGDGPVRLQPRDQVILALPPKATADAIPGLVAPTDHRRDRERPLRCELPCRHAVADGCGKRVIGLDLRLSGPNLGDCQRNGPGRHEPPGNRPPDLDRGLLRHWPVHDGPVGYPSALAGYPRKTSDLRANT